ncbi:hypothetical protein Tco_0824044 [Tanacetum coccineum]|uniref:Uncharacterized protein n=1 Tax=Tanacetum coccineum TaxID=301880 RepID=A0ABQ5AJM8_9ASTR
MGYVGYGCVLRLEKTCDINVDDLLTETAQYMASPTKQASGSGGASEASFREDEDYNMYGGYKDYAYDLTEQHKALFDS